MILFHVHLYKPQVGSPIPLDSSTFSRTYNVGNFGGIGFLAIEFLGFADSLVLVPCDLLQVFTRR